MEYTQLDLQIFIREMGRLMLRINEDKKKDISYLFNYSYSKETHDLTINIVKEQENWVIEASYMYNIYHTEGQTDMTFFEFLDLTEIISVDLEFKQIISTMKIKTDENFFFYLADIENKAKLN